MDVHSHRDLIVWQKAMDLVVLVYRFTEQFPKSEIYGLSSQMRRSAVSIPSNIAEGRKRGTRKDYRQFLLIAYGSGGELETQVEIAKRLTFGNEKDRLVVDQTLNEVMRMLNVITSKLADPSNKPNKLTS
ncbi:MAG: four helix bundle protein [Candidatus Peregrinibacteria bacterium]